MFIDICHVYVPHLHVVFYVIVYAQCAFLMMTYNFLTLLCIQLCNDVFLENKDFEICTPSQHCTLGKYTPHILAWPELQKGKMAGLVS